MQIATSKENFIFNMQKDGYSTEWEENKAYCFSASKSILKGKKDKFRLSNLEKTFNIPDFNKERLLEIFKLNQEQERKNILEKITDNMGIEKNIPKKIFSEKRNVKTNNYKKRKREKELEF